MNREDRKNIPIYQQVIFRRMEDYIYSRYCEEKNIPFTHLLILDVCYMNTQGIEPSVLADIVVIPRQTLTSILNEFEQKGFIEREKHLSDGRKKLVKILPKGETYIKDVLEELVERDIESASCLTPAEQAMYVELYIKLIKSKCKVYGIEDLPMMSMLNYKIL